MNGRVFSSPVAGFSMTHIKGSKCAMISRAEHQRVALQEPPRARRQRAAVVPRKRRVVPAPDVAQDGGLKFRHDVQGDDITATATTKKTRTFIGPDFFSARKKRSRAMKLALGLQCQGGEVHVHRGLPSGRAGAQGGRGGAGAKRVGVCFASNTDLELWTEEVEQGVVDNMIVFQKPFPGGRPHRA